MFYVARACLYSRNAPTVQKLGKVVLLTMSANEVPEATLHLLRLAVRQDEGLSRARRAYDSTELSFARRHLRKLVAEKHPHAMVFQAKRLAAEGRRKEAIEMLTDAVSSGAAELQEVEEDAESMHKQYSGIVLQDNEASKGESPWTFLAQLHRTEGNPKGAEEAFRAGAMIDDDPKAYEGLCGTVPRFSKQWHEWMTKAAASGSWTAMNWLGRFYSVPLDQIPEEANVREEARLLEESEPKVDWWYYYLDDKELGALGEQPGTKIVGADFWRSYRDPRTDSKLHMVQLNPRTALAMEWYELAWRSQFIFSDKRDVTINLAIQELIENAGSQDSSRSEPKRSLSSTMRHHRQHFANKGTFIWELAMIDFSEIKDGLRKVWAKTFGKKG
ncbi:Tetratricopeptide-like helical [Macrophomina phaseolina MS6]|uniref:Tetratricopeptide-like helical n=2 Tax=Macrophomina phaseolina TaxID=35725 RepID=K2R7N9_MACPH|nr:Tetratricopeptide-like helical [Macrophomina phaseolina MS6]